TSMGVLLRDNVWYFSSTSVMHRHLRSRALGPLAGDVFILVNTVCTSRALCVETDGSITRLRKNNTLVNIFVVKKVMSSKRYFDNPYEDYRPSDAVLDQNSDALNTQLKDNFLKEYSKLLTHFEANVGQNIDSNDYSVYTGSTGYALLYLHLFHVLLLAFENLFREDNQNECNSSLNTLKSMVKYCTDIGSDTPDELLYGRSGFLYSLLYVRKFVPTSHQFIEDKDIRAVVDAIIKSGQRSAQKENMSAKCPLMYYWYKSPYLGAAHGYIGIMALLLEAKSYLTDEELNKCVKPTIDFILSLRLSSGNFPSGLDDMSDVLVHWCHGSPGAVHIFALAYEVFKEERYLTAAKDCCEVVWKRGLLVKGYGLCHGTAGNGYAFLRMYQLTKEEKYVLRAVRFDKALPYIQPVIKRLRLKRRDISFLLGDSGVLSIASVIHHLKGNQNECNSSLNTLKSMVKYCTDIGSDTPDELLYGRSGFLYSLLYVRKFVPTSHQIIEDKDIRAVVDAIIKSGQRSAQKDNMSAKCPLMYYWHKSAYLGAAHGYIGIMALLLEAKSYLTDDELNKCVKPTIDFILSLRLSSGNFPSGLDDMSDVLVHWCHGSPGTVHMFALAYQVFKDDKYLTAAKDCCELVWKRGLLVKGYGLCHGTAGNGYAFLRMYQLTKEEKYVLRAVKFGQWCCDYGKHGCRTADRPFSMFEGLAGTLYYLTDLLRPKNSRFPAYQLTN
ncbi:unnamed protein product, partial [Medioppia subpectinata]